MIFICYIIMYTLYMMNISLTYIISRVQPQIKKDIKRLTDCNHINPISTQDSNVWHHTLLWSLDDRLH